MVGANSIGIKTIFAKYGDAFGVKDSGANWDIEDISEVIDIIDEINNA
jgi:putative hydrolase of the HAD superfamily